jgi:acetyl esterase/lipase/predicted enzyme related to lactoylglutathione lyase
MWFNSQFFQLGLKYMKHLFFFILIIISGTISGRTTISPEKTDSATSLSTVKESYKLSGHHLAALAEKVLYKKTPQEDMYLYILRPEVETKKALPAIVYFTGGGWVAGDVYGQIPNPAWFRDHGIIGIEADYRVKSRHGTTPIECIQDAKSAIRFVREHAKELGIDPNKIIAAGGSAGGHLAACTFLDGGDTPGEDLSISSKPNAIVMHNPVLGEGFGKEFFDAHPEFSPILHVKKGCPPTILSNGTKDNTTPFQYAEKFTRLMKEAGNVCELIPVKDADHSCDWPVSNPNFLPTLQRMTDFLKEQKMMYSDANQTQKEAIMKDTIPKVTGIGGIFFRSKNPAQTREWYAKNLGLSVNEYGSTFEFRNSVRPDEINYLQWSPFAEKTTYFDPSEKEFMINYRVQNIEGLVKKLKENGVSIVDKIEEFEYGKFVHILDQEGNKIELWEPIDSVLTKMGGSTTK